MTNPTTRNTLAVTTWIKSLYNKLSYYIREYSASGMDHAENTEEKKKIYAINTLSILTSFLVLTIGYAYYQIAHKTYVIIPVITEGICFALIPLLNRRGMVRAAANATYMLHAICACYFGCILGMVVEIQLVVVFFIMAAYLVTQSKVDRRIYIISSIIALICMEVNYFFELIPSLELTRNQGFFFRWAAIFGILTLIIKTVKLYDTRNNDAQEKLRKANEAKTKFVREVSHEVRIPLNTSLQIVQILEREIRNNPYLEHLQPLIRTLYFSTSLQKGIVNNVLYLAQIEEGKLYNQEKRSFNLEDTLSAILEMHKVYAAQKNVTIKLSVDSKMPVFIHEDELKLTQIINNILINAVKFTNVRSVVRVAVKRQEDTWSLAIKDQGPGMNQDEITQILQPFNSTRSDLNIEGTGLGLQISRQLIELLGGSYNIQSRPGHGTSFTVILPLTEGEVVLPENHRDHHLNLFGYRALIIEDDPLSAMFLKMHLASQNCEVFTAANKAEGLAAAEKHKPHIIFVDACMPYSDDGHDTITELRENPFFRNTFIIGVPGNAFQDDIKNLTQAGADICCPKPISYEVLNPILLSFTMNYQKAQHR